VYIVRITDLQIPSYLARFTTGSLISKSQFVLLVVTISCFFVNVIADYIPNYSPFLINVNLYH
jgi:hypothetical protein